MKMNLRERMLNWMKSNKNLNKLHKDLIWYLTVLNLIGRNIRIHVRTIIGIWNERLNNWIALKLN